MKKYILAAALGSAMIVAIPASASPTGYFFDTTGCSGSGNTACGQSLSQYGPVNSTGTLTGITATALGVYYAAGTTTTAPTAALTAGLLGAYSGAGLGACQTTTGNNCTDPNHQIANGNNGSGPNDYEFILIRFSSAIDLNSIQLGNFSGGSADPFNLTYYTSSATSLATALSATTLSAFTGTGTSVDGFSSAQSVTASGCSRGTLTNPTACTDTTSATDVQYLLIGASILDSGTDYFKIQSITGSNNTGGSGSSGTPEPATFGMIGLALAGLGIYGRKRKSSNS